MPALEGIDARIGRRERDGGAPVRARTPVSGSAANAGTVLVEPVRPTDLRWVGALPHRNGAAEESGVAGEPPLAPRREPPGRPDRPGGVVTRPVDTRPGDTFHAASGPLGGVAFRFAP
jgi:2-oxo-hept-3-ene-1,7-dioate hydratase